ncbi:unannotated protein [freshwater metagenome]|uniref:Unannotated protein n=1 Tax=freshwater metagenome TaxID=449393 RepID=A0A6J6W7V5_9ZZZZ|nr:hypothetical protein [Actinomycetota bacterium]
MKTSLSASARPQLKSGIIVLPYGENTYIGFSDHGIEFEGLHVRPIVAALTGNQTCQEIHESLGYDLDLLTSLVVELDSLHFLDTTKSSITLQDRFHSPSAHRQSHIVDNSHDATFQQIQTRIRPELTLTTWLPNVDDGGVSHINARQDCDVRIYGSSRIASILYGILLSSGVSNTRLTTQTHSPLISELDLCAGIFRPSDIGASFEDRACTLGKELSLFPINPPSPRNAIAINVGAPDPELLQEWMSECTPHLFIEDPECASLILGPFVVPGTTPCWRCTVLTKDDEYIAWKQVQWERRISPHSETPVSVAHYVAGLAALEILRFIDTQHSDLLGSTLRVNYLAANETERRRFSFHPACGCHW